MASRDIVVVGASAGGFEALKALVSGLPGNLPAAIFIVVHTPAGSISLLPELLARVGPIAVRHAVDGEEIRHGQVYVAPPDQHLLLFPDHMKLTGGPKENGFRPAVDPLFRTAASAFGPRVVGVVLSGGLDDGTGGLLRIKKMGGLAVVQDPADALVAGMPQSALDNVAVDHVAKAADLGRLLTRLVRQTTKKGNGMPRKPLPHDPAEGTADSISKGMLPGCPSGFVCPDCGGALWELEDEKQLTYRCHVGHGFTADGLLAQQGEHLDAAMWTALRTLEDHAALQRRLAERTRARGLGAIADRYDEQARQTEARAEVIRRVVVESGPMTQPKATPRPKKRKTG